MKILLAGVVLGMAAAPAVAESRHDRKLEQAVMNIVAAKMGDLRGGLAISDQPFFVSDAMTTASVPPGFARSQASGPWQDGLAPATERRLADIKAN